MDLEQAIITGTFGVVVAMVTWLLAGLREIGVSKRELKKERVNKLENIYAQTISLLEQLIRITESGESYEQIEKQLADNNALIKLLSSKNVNDKLEQVSELMYSWSSNYRQGEPKSMSHNMVMVTSQDSKYTKAAEEIFQCLNDEIISLVNIMKNHLDNERKT